MSGMKRRVYISDHGTFDLFDMNISLPAIIELTEDQIAFINNSGVYKISELNASQSVKATPTVLSVVDGDRFEHARTVSVNELSFKMPIMGTEYAKKAKNAIIVKKNSIYANAALKQANNNSNTETVKESDNSHDVISASNNIIVNSPAPTAYVDTNTKSTTFKEEKEEVLAPLNAINNKNDNDHNDGAKKKKSNNNDETNKN